MIPSKFHSLIVLMCLSILGVYGTGWGQPIAGIEALRAKAKSSRVVRVIAQLKTPPQGLSTMALRQAQVSLSDVMKKAGATDAHAIEGLPYVVLSVDDQRLTALEESNQISRVFEDKINKAYLAESVPLIEAPPVWVAGGEGQGQTVAILDTGVESSHPFLANKVVAEACFSTNFADHGATTVCPNGQEEQIGSGAGEPCSVDGCAHGTHVAGIAAGKGNAFKGVAPEANIIAIQVFSKFSDQPGGPHVCQDLGTTSPCVLTYTSDQIRALQHVLTLAGQHPIAAVNMSLGGGHSATHCDSDVRKDSIDQLRNVNIATVIASGNESFTDGVGEPACISTGVTVGATTKSDQVVNFSNSSPLVDLLAPGVSINSSVPNGQFDSFSGTSMATPMVAGAWAVLRSLNPGHDVGQITQALETTGTLILDSRNGVEKPRIDVRAASGISGNEVDLALSISGTPASVNPGDSLTYSIIINNVGAVDATNVVLTDTLPAGTEFRSASFPGCKHQNGKVTCSWMSIPSQQEETMTVLVDVKESSSGMLSNSATVESQETDSDETNNSATVETPVVLAGAICQIPNSSIPDHLGGEVSDTINVQESKILSGLKVDLRLDHTWVGDLKVQLEHIPSQANVVLMDRPGVPPGNGCSQDNINASFDDGAATSVETTCHPQGPAISGTVRPEEPLLTFKNRNLQGEWRLLVSDHASGDTGLLKEWCLVPETAIQEIEVAPPPTQGNIQTSNQQDTYAFQVDKEGAIRILVEGSAQLRVTLQTAETPPTVIASNGDGTVAHQSVVTTLLPGIYHITVAPLNDQQMGAYTLRVEAQGE